MLEMILKMSALTAIHVVLTILLRIKWKGREMSGLSKVLIGVLFGCTAVLSTHFGVQYESMTVNVRDLSPLSAGLFFDPVSGIIAGLIGGIERYIAGTYWNVSSYTCIACSVSTCLAGFLSAVLNRFLFKRKTPSAIYGLFIGAVMEVFHMYVVFITHRNDMNMAFYVVRICAVPMILFNAAGLAVTALVLYILEGQGILQLLQGNHKAPLSRKFQGWLFLITVVVLLLNFGLSYSLQTASAMQDAAQTLTRTADDEAELYKLLGVSDSDNNYDASNMNLILSRIQPSSNGSVDFVNGMGYIPIGNHKISILDPDEREALKSHESGDIFESTWFTVSSLCIRKDLEDGMILVAAMPLSEVYAQRDQQTYEQAFSAIILFAVIYILISILAEQLVVSGIIQVNQSLDRIASGKLDEMVNVRSSMEFDFLSDNINQMVTALKVYIADAQNRIAQELELAHNIQESALPRNFDFDKKDFSIYALMDPAKEVGGDFYDFFLIDRSRLVLVIADVSGKGIPAAMFMMRSKTAIRSMAGSDTSPAEILRRVNNELCEGNDAEMFVTVWIGIVDLDTGIMTCANAGHEYPVFMPADGSFELIKDRHGLVLAAMEDVYYQDYKLQFHPGDRLFVYTDGVPEAVNEDMEQYGTERMVQKLNVWKDKDIREVAPMVREDIRAFAGKAEQFDDITMLEFIFTEKGGDGV